MALITLLQIVGHQVPVSRKRLQHKFIVRCLKLRLMVYDICMTNSFVKLGPGPHLTCLTASLSSHQRFQQAQTCECQISWNVYEFH